MKIYLDLVLILNFVYDLLLLMCVDVTLKRFTKFYRLIISALAGALSLIILFLPFNKYVLFLFKVLVSLFMIIIAFGYKNIKYFFTNIWNIYSIHISYIKWCTRLDFIWNCISSSDIRNCIKCSKFRKI